MSDIRNELKYVASHEWIRDEGDGTVTIGITDHAQQMLGDVVFVELPEIGAELTLGEETGVVESVKAASDVFAPVSGEVVEINEQLEEEPEQVNTDPYGDGWFFRVKLSEVSEMDDLLTADAYGELCEEEA